MYTLVDRSIDTLHTLLNTQTHSHTRTHPHVWVSQLTLDCVWATLSHQFDFRFDLKVDQRKLVDCGKNFMLCLVYFYEMGYLNQIEVLKSFSGYLKSGQSWYNFLKSQGLKVLRS